jgi:hypothetical protein
MLVSPFRSPYLSPLGMPADKTYGAPGYPPAYLQEVGTAPIPPARPPFESIELPPTRLPGWESSAEAAASELEVVAVLDEVMQDTFEEILAEILAAAGMAPGDLPDAVLDELWEKLKPWVEALVSKRLAAGTAMQLLAAMPEGESRERDALRYDFKRTLLQSDSLELEVHLRVLAELDRVAVAIRSNREFGAAVSPGLEAFADRWHEGAVRAHGAANRKAQELLADMAMFEDWDREISRRNGWPETREGAHWTGITGSPFVGDKLRRMADRTRRRERRYLRMRRPRCPACACGRSPDRPAALTVRRRRCPGPA